MKVHPLLGIRLKDDDVIDLLEQDDVAVTYDFDRSHENIPDRYWAAAREEGYQLRFNAEQVLDTIFLYAQSLNGFEAIDRARIDDIEFFDSPVEVETHCKASQEQFTKGRASGMFGLPPTEWVRIEASDRTIHYEFRDGELALVTLSARQPKEM